MTIPFYFVALLALIIVPSGCASPSAQSQSPQRENSITALETRISSRVIETQFSGVVLVADRNEIIFERAFNVPSLGEEFQVDVESQFPIASITKSFTAILVLQYVELGLLNLGDPVAHHLPDFSASYADRATIRDLLQNRSGIPNFTELPGWFDTSYKETLTPDVLMSELASLSLEFEPGADYLYSNANFYLLGRIVEAITDKSYAEALSENILEPLNLDDTHQVYDAPDFPMTAKNAVRQEDGTYNHIPIVNPSVFDATASISTTARDLFDWQAAIYGDVLLSAERKDLLFDINMPMAWTVGRLPIETGHEVLVQTYSGELLGYNSMLTRFPERNAAVIILNNNDAGYDQLAGLTMEIAREIHRKAGGS